MTKRTKPRDRRPTVAELRRLMERWKRINETESGEWSLAHGVGYAELAALLRPKKARRK